MAVAGVSNLAVPISKAPLQQDQTVPSKTQAAQAQNVPVITTALDSFTPSTQTVTSQATAQAAGLFQVSQYALSTATASVLSVQATPPQAGQTSAPSQTAAAAPAQSAAAAPNIQPSTASAPAPTTGAPAPAPTQTAAGASAESAAQTQEEVEALNTVLISLGFSSADIQAMDQIATVTNDFNPPLYSDLVQQFEGQSLQQTTPAPAVANQPTPQAKATAV